MKAVMSIVNFTFNTLNHRPQHDKKRNNNKNTYSIAKPITRGLTQQLNLTVHNKSNETDKE